MLVGFPWAVSATRGAGAPPSLRRVPPFAPPPSPASQRGAPAPLPHCGLSVAFGFLTARKSTRGAGAPPSLRRVFVPVGRRGGGHNEGRRRPSLIAALSRCRLAISGGVQRGAPAPLPHCGPSEGCFRGLGRLQRGAPAPLPHCGKCPKRTGYAPGGSTRGAGAPPSLRPCRARCRVRRCGRPTRGAGAPPSLRPLSLSVSKSASASTRGAGAPPSLRRRRGAAIGLGSGTTRGAGAPPSLRR